MFYLVKENKIAKHINSLLIEELVGMKEDDYMQRRKQRKDISCNEQDSLKNYFKHFSGENNLKNMIDHPAKEVLEMI